MKKILAPILILTLLILPLHLHQVRAEEVKEKSPEVSQLVDKLNSRQSQVLKNWNAKLFYSQAELDQEQKKLSDRIAELTKVTAAISGYEQKIDGLKKNILTLNNELSILENSMELTKLQIRNVQIQVAEKEQSIKNTHEKISITEVAKNEQDRIVSTYIELLYKQNQIYFAPEKNFTTDISYFASPDGLSDILMANRYATVLRQNASDYLNDLEDVNMLLGIRRKQLDNDQIRLTSLKNTLKTEENSLKEQTDAKAFLLAKTQGEQKNFEQLLAENKKDQEQIEQDVADQQKNIKEVIAKLEAFQKNIQKNSLTPAEIAERAKILEQLGEGTSGKIGLDWPVAPLRGIAAFFHDAGYVKVFGVDHNAIDIPTPQGTEIKSPADGYVTKVRDAGMGYSYIMVAHNSGVMTLYGHVSKILVSAGDIVKRGDIIGLSGGAPGTKGAGWMTTGSHLHFEVFQNGAHVDPLGYLDNSVLKK